MDLALAGKVALVAGSSRGIGKAIALQLLKEGARVMVTGRDKKALRQTLREGRALAHSKKIDSFAGDLTSEAQLSRVVASIGKKWGAIDCLVANIGSGSADGGWNVPRKEWDRVFETNFWSSARLIQKTLPSMVKRKAGSILSIASIVGLESLNAPLTYSCAKAALIHFNKNLSRLVAAEGVRVNVIAPGNIFFPGGTWEKKIQRDGVSVKKYIQQEVPMQRFGSVDDVAALAAFLLSDRASFITGSCFVADGGQLRSV